MQKYLILILCLSIFPILHAQEEIDTTDQKTCEHLDDLIWIKDSSYKAFKTYKFSSLRVFYTTYSTYKSLIDSTQAGKQSEITKYYMYNQVWNGLRYQHTKMMVKSKKAGIDWNKTVLDSFYIDSGISGTVQYAYVNWFVKYNNKRKYHYRALFLCINHNWYIMDELKFIGLVVEKKKKKKKK